MLTPISFLPCSLEPSPIKLSPFLLKLLWSRSNVLHISNQLMLYHSLFYRCPFLPSWYSFFTWLRGHCSVLVFPSTSLPLLLSLLCFSSSLRPFMVECPRAQGFQPFTFLFILLSYWSHVGYGFKCHLCMEDSHVYISSLCSSLLSSILKYPNACWVPHLDV